MNARRTFVAFVMLATSLAWPQQYQYPFQNPNLPVEARINSILSLMTLDEKISALSTDPDVPRLGIQGSKHIEGLPFDVFQNFLARAVVFALRFLAFTFDRTRIRPRGLSK